MQYTIKIKTTKSQLFALNKVWDYIEFLDDTNPENKAIISMARKIAEKLTKKKVSVMFKDDTRDKEYTISFEYFEAYFLELLIRKSLHVFPLGYEKQVLQNIADDLNQKLA